MKPKESNRIDKWHCNIATSTRVSYMAMPHIEQTARERNTIAFATHNKQKTITKTKQKKTSRHHQTTCKPKHTKQEQPQTRRVEYAAYPHWDGELNVQHCMGWR